MFESKYQDLTEGKDGNIYCRNCGELAIAKNPWDEPWVHCICEKPRKVQERQSKRDSKTIKSVRKAMRAIGGDVRYQRD